MTAIHPDAIEAVLLCHESDGISREEMYVEYPNDIDTQARLVMRAYAARIEGLEERRDELHELYASAQRTIALLEASNRAGWKIAENSTEDMAKEIRALRTAAQIGLEHAKKRAAEFRAAGCRLVFADDIASIEAALKGKPMASSEARAQEEKTVILTQESGCITAAGYDFRYGAARLAISDSGSLIEMNEVNYGLDGVARMARQIAALCTEFADECERREPYWKQRTNAAEVEGQDGPAAGARRTGRRQKEQNDMGLSVEVIFGSYPEFASSVRRLRTADGDDKNVIKAHRELRAGMVTAFTDDEVAAFNVGKKPEDQIPSTEMVVTRTRFVPSVPLKGGELSNGGDNVLTIYASPV